MPPAIRGSDIYIQEDVLRMLRAIAATHEAMRQVANSSDHYAQGYSVGFMDGLRAIAESMGVRFEPGESNVSIGRRREQ